MPKKGRSFSKKGSGSTVESGVDSSEDDIWAIIKKTTGHDVDALLLQYEEESRNDGYWSSNPNDSDVEVDGPSKWSNPNYPTVQSGVDIGWGTVEDIGGGSKVELAGVDSCEDDISAGVDSGEDDIWAFIKESSGIDIDAILLKYKHLWFDRRKVGSVRRHHSDLMSNHPYQSYYETANRLRSSNKRRGDEVGHEWVVNRSFSGHGRLEDWAPLGKSLFSCFRTLNGNYVVLSVHYLSSSSPLMSWTKVMTFNMDDWELGDYPVHCVSHRSQIMFGGRSSWRNPSVASRHAPSSACAPFAGPPSSARGLSKLPDLPPNSLSLLMVELGSNLHVLFFDKKRNKYSLNVLDLHDNRWLNLPQPPYLGFWFNHLGPLICPAVVGTKLLLFVQAKWDDVMTGPYWDTLDRKVFCFDPASSNGREWRQLPAPSFCFNLRRGMSNQAAALVLNESNMNIMFLFDHVNYRIGVHTLELHDDDFGLHNLELDDDIMSSKLEVVKLIGYFKLPKSRKFTLPGQGEFVHIGARKVCFVGADVYVPSKEDPCLVVIPFEFDIDISKENAGKSFTLNFMAPRISETYPIDHYEIGSFLL